MGFFNFSSRKNKHEFRFSEPQNTAVYTCEEVINGDCDVLLAIHDHEGEWQFLCGTDEHVCAEPKLISILQVTQLDPTLNELYEMPKGVGARRSKVGDKWKPFRLE